MHCYRMLGSFQDAEDALQDSLLAAWRGLDSFQGRASLRTWLYKIATNRCLNARRSVARRRAHEWDVPGVEPPEPTRLGEVVWLEPLPDALVEGGIDVPLGPEARYEQTESVTLAFVTALQVLPPRQIAVLVLRDVLGFSAKETAEMLDSTVESVTSALKRARANLDRRRLDVADREPPPAPRSPAEDELLTKFVTAYEAADLDAVVALLTDDVFISMPPMPFEYEGRDAVADFCTRIFTAGPSLRPRPHPRERPAGVRRLPPRPRRHQPRHRPLRAHPQRRPDQRHDPLRGQRPALVRPPAVAAGG